MSLVKPIYKNVSKKLYTSLKIDAIYNYSLEPRPQGINVYSCSTQMSLKVVLIIDFKMTTNVGILKCVNWTNDICCSIKE